MWDEQRACMSNIQRFDKVEAIDRQDSEFSGVVFCGNVNVIPHNKKTCFWFIFEHASNSHRNHTPSPTHDHFPCFHDIYIFGEGQTLWISCQARVGLNHVISCIFSRCSNIIIIILSVDFGTRFCTWCSFCGTSNFCEAKLRILFLAQFFFLCILFTGWWIWLHNIIRYVEGRRTI